MSAALGAVLSALSALAFYAASAHCRWPVLARPRRLWQAVAWLTTAAALFLWIRALGTAAGLCVMLGCWMLAALVFPWLAVLFPARAAQKEAR